MRVEFSKEFEKAVRKLSGKMLDSVLFGGSMPYREVLRVCAANLDENS